MGVPAFFRWLVEKYPKMVAFVLEERSKVVEGTVIPVDLTQSNPDEIEYDNLYIDMNGLIHPCSHPEDRDAPTSEAEMYVNVTKYIDRLFAAVRPRRLLYLAIDGVAPRAKMNQQRSRRFRAAQEAKERKTMMEEVVEEMKSLGIPPPPNSGHSWDSNVITPGTEFMHKLSTYIWFYVLDRMNKIPAWRDIKVIFSDASVPGEGEHKIMSFIRNQRSQPDFDPNQRHILHGLDADLIMLALATHESHFSILREEVSFGNKKDKDDGGTDAQRFLDNNVAALSALHPEDEWVYAKRLQVAKIHVLREYLNNEFKILEKTVPFLFDFERCIDDFVFMCFFVGNDFLPHLPSMDIRDGAVDFLLECYKELLPSMGDYLTSPGGNVNLQQVDVMLSRVGEIEDDIFKKRKHSEDQQEARKAHQASSPCFNFQKGSCQHGSRCRFSHSQSRSKESFIDSKSFKPSFEMVSLIASKSKSSESLPNPLEGIIDRVEQTKLTFVGKTSENSNISAAEKLRSLIKKRKTSDSDSVIEPNELEISNCSNSNQDSETETKKAKIEEDIEIKTEILSETEQMIKDSLEELPEVEVVDEDEDEDVDVDVTLDQAIQVVEDVDEEIKRRFKLKEQAKIDNLKTTIVDDIKFHESGWKSRYYGDKFKKEDIENGGGLLKMCETYIQGLCWVFKYYYQGCPSWSWYYPFHYAPFASDLVNIDRYTIKFELHQPFRPFEQLLAVLPADSKNALPECCQWLMIDKKSPIIDIYNDDIPIDPNGKHLPHQWVLLLPFLDEARINNAFALVADKLSKEEVYRNSEGRSIIFIHHSSPVASGSLAVLSKSEESVEFDSSQGVGMGGVLSKAPEEYKIDSASNVKAPIRPIGAFDDIVNNQVDCFSYHLQPDNFHVSSLLNGVTPVPAELSVSDLIPRRPPRLNKGRFNIVDIAIARKSNLTYGGAGANSNSFLMNMNNYYGNVRQSNSNQHYHNSNHRLDQNFRNSNYPPSHSYEMHGNGNHSQNSNYPRDNRSGFTHSSPNYQGQPMGMQQYSHHGGPQYHKQAPPPSHPPHQPVDFYRAPHPNHSSHFAVPHHSQGPNQYQQPPQHPLRNYQYNQQPPNQNNNFGHNDRYPRANSQISDPSYTRGSGNQGFSFQQKLHEQTFDHSNPHPNPTSFASRDPRLNNLNNLPRHPPPPPHYANPQFPMPSNQNFNRINSDSYGISSQNNPPRQTNNRDPRRRN